MTKLIVSTSIFLAALSASAGVTATQAYITKDLKSVAGVFYKAQTAESYCRGFGTAVRFGSFEVARTMEGLEDGFYNCTGQFVRQPTGGLDLFTIDSCVIQNPNEMTCP